MDRICSECAYFLPHDIAKLQAPDGSGLGQHTGICALKAGDPGAEKGSYLVEGTQEACASFELNPEAGEK